jgi:plastocyanin
MPTGSHDGVNARVFLGIAVAVSALILGSMLVLQSGTPARARAIVEVDVWEIGNSLYTPQGVSVNVGDTVMWLDYDDYGHTTTSFPDQAESWNSGAMTEMATFYHTFTHAGNFTYYSTIPEDAGYTGWVYVMQPVPEFSGFALWLTLAASVGVAMMLSSRLQPSRTRILWAQS